MRSRNTVGIFGGQLYTTGEVTSGITPPYLIGTVGNGLPKTPTSAEASLPGIPPTNDANASDFWFRDADTLYLNVLTSGTPNPGIQKWTYDGTSWQYQYNLFTFGFNYLSGWVDPSGNTVLFASSGTSLLRIVDGGSQALSKSSVLATAATGTSFAGVTFIASVPEPASLALTVLGIAGMLVVARRRRITAARITISALCALSTILISAVTAMGAGFQPNGVVVLREFSGAFPHAVELDEYSPSGLQTSPINVVSIPSSGTDKLTILGSNQLEGDLQLSGDGSYLVLGGIDANAGGPFSSTLSATNRVVVGRVNVSDGTIDLSTKIDTVSGSGAHNADLYSVTSNGSDIWATGPIGAGVNYTTVGSSTMTRVNQSSDTTLRSAVGIFAGQLYTSSDDTNGSSALNSLSAIGSGLPTVPAPEILPPGLPRTGTVNTVDFWFRDANTVYLTNTIPSRAGVQKWTFDGAIWQYQYNVFTSPVDYLTGWVDPSGNTVLFTTFGNHVQRIVDGGSQTLSTSSILASGFGFRGVAFIASVPEPSSFFLMGLGGLVLAPLIRWRRLQSAIKH